MTSAVAASEVPLPAPETPRGKMPVGRTFPVEMPAVDPSVGAGSAPTPGPAAAANLAAASTTSTNSTRSALRSDRARQRRPYLAPVPDCQPPFDDERTAVSRLAQLRTAVQLRSAAGTARRAGGVVADPPSPPTRVSTVQDGAVPGWSQDADMGVRRTATAELPPATRFGPVLARALVEVLSGQRPVPQLRVHCAPDVFAGLSSRPIAAGALGHLLSVRVAEPADGVAEVAVVFRRAERVRALAFRIQGVDGRWRVTALQTG